MLGPSLAESIPFYQARNKRLSLPKLVESFSVTNSHLTELTFAPMLVGSTLTSGKMDEILNVSTFDSRVTSPRYVSTSRSFRSIFLTSLISKYEPISSLPNSSDLYSLLQTLLSYISRFTFFLLTHLPSSLRLSRPLLTELRTQHLREQ
jgi:hypothetical protein